MELNQEMSSSSSNLEESLNNLAISANGNGEKDEASKKNAKDFTFGRVLGEGAYGAVVLGKDNDTGREFAIKMLEKKHLIKEKKVKYATTERDILTMCNHPNIVKLYYTFKDDIYLYYVLELCPNGELLGQLKKAGSFDLPVAAFYTAEIINALEYLHNSGIIHRDLKPENVLLDEHMHAKLTDFGTAKMIGTERNARSNSFVGTAEYVSPELLNDKITCKSSDLWALGCTIYQMIAGRPPFRAISEFLIFQQISQGQLKYPKGFPELVKDLVDKLLVADPDNRLGASSFKDLKSHPFFKDINFENLHKQTPPSIKPYPQKLIFEEDIVQEEEAKRRKMQEEESEKWKRFLKPDEIILESGLVWKRKGRSVKKRQLILTNAPRIIYIDPKKMVMKGEIPWTSNLRPEAKNNVAWFIHTPKRTFILEDVAGNAQRWVDAITKILDNN